MNTNITHNDLLNNPAFVIQVHHAATRAHECLPSANGRIERAVELVLAGAVEAAGCGRWDVASQTSFPETWYRVYNGGCNCLDYVANAYIVPTHSCKHLIAVAIYQKAVQEMEREHMQYETPEPHNPDEVIEEENTRLCWEPVTTQGTLLSHRHLDGTPCHEVYEVCPGHAGIDGDDTQEPQDTTPAPLSLETLDGDPDDDMQPCTASYTMMLCGHAVTVQLSDTNDIRLMARVEAMLEYYAERDAEDIETVN